MITHKKQQKSKFDVSGFSRPGGRRGFTNSKVGHVTTGTPPTKQIYIFIFRTPSLPYVYTI